MKYPIGIQTFSQIRENGYVYVDKTDLIYQSVSRGSIYFLQPSAPFRQKYYEGRKEVR